jgi:hypothetical protein
MSSTKRGRKRNRADNYPTRAWCVRRALEVIPLPLVRPQSRWLEPCAGDGAIIRAVKAMGIHVDWTAVELREDAMPALEETVRGTGASFCTDFLQSSDAGLYEVAITNPPFKKAMAFIEKCRAKAQHVVMLLRLNFLSSEERQAFMRFSHPDIYVLPNRPSFASDGSTDSIEYAWFHWHEGSTGKWVILNTTPLAERKEETFYRKRKKHKKVLRKTKLFEAARRRRR